VVETVIEYQHGGPRLLAAARPQPARPSHPPKRPRDPTRALAALVGTELTPMIYVPHRRPDRDEQVAADQTVAERRRTTAASRPQALPECWSVSRAILSSQEPNAALAAALPRNQIAHP
jgi:hypothetical protein